jgi:hypothetical protein
MIPRVVTTAEATRYAKARNGSRGLGQSLFEVTLPPLDTGLVSSTSIPTWLQQVQQQDYSVSANVPSSMPSVPLIGLGILLLILMSGGHR